MADTSPNVNAGTESGHSGASTDPGPSHRNTEQQTHYVMGVPSARPELGTHTAATLHRQEWKTAMRENLVACHDAIFRQLHFCEMIQKTTSPETSSMFLLENALFDMATCGLSEGCLYGIMFRHQRKNYFRFFESGIYDGFFESKGLNLLKTSFPNMTETELFWEKAFTEDDVIKVTEKYMSSLADKRSKVEQSKSKKLPLAGRRYKSILFDNKNSIKNSLDSLLHHVQTSVFQENLVECLGVLVCVEKKKSFKDTNCMSYHSASKVFASEEFKTAFTSYRLEGPSSEARSLDIFSPLVKPVSWNQQMKFISSLPNYHRWIMNKVNFSQWLSIMDVKDKYRPASARNQILYFYRDGCLNSVFDVCQKLQGNQPEVRPSSSTFCTVSNSEDANMQPSFAKRRTRQPLKRLTVEELRANITSLDPEFSSQNIFQEASPYEKFKLAVTENGNLFWRRSGRCDHFALNDVNMTTGIFQEDCYVHLTLTTSDGVSELSCSCSMYTTLVQIASFGVSEQEFEDMNLENVNCCHMRLFNEMILDHLPAIRSLTSNSENNLVKKLEDNLHKLNETICYLPTVSKKSLKFSVYSDYDERCCFVHITDNRICCQSGYCDAVFKCSKRSVVHFDKAVNLCPHLMEMKNNGVWRNFLPKADSEEAGGLSQDEDDNDQANDEDEPVPPRPAPELKGHRFNADTGLWEYPCLSKHPPAEDGSLSLQESIQRRQQLGDRSLGRDPDGFLFSDAGGSYDIMLPTDPAPDTCKCGAGYGDYIIVQGPYLANVYTLHGPAKYQIKITTDPLGDCLLAGLHKEIYIRKCLKKNPDCDIGPGSNESVHFFTKLTGAGDEIAYEFIDLVLKCSTTFSAYCDIKSTQYKRINDKSASFMSNNTFIYWWFSWISKFNIDFRIPCKLCKFKPNMLAADGTKIGINVSNSNILPIETPTDQTAIDPCHRRNERAFISYTQGAKDAKEKARSRDHILYHCKRALGTLGTNNELPIEDEMTRNDKLLEHVDEAFRPLLHLFIYHQYSVRLGKKLAILFKILSSNHSLSSVLPFRYLQDFQLTLTALRLNPNLNNAEINKVAVFSPEIKDVLLNAKGTPVMNDAIAFFEHLIERVEAIFHDCKEPDAINPKHDSYNPSKFGRAYYFTPHGQQIRDIPVYTMGSSGNYDDEPARADERCNKKYPEVGRRGTTYLFLWFDPQHYGHCYGYHMIPGSEGRKDPACSAYAFMESAPLEMFYDFSCQLEEYCLNREPGFWKRTQFFHDTFHGFCHSCAIVYTSSRLRILRKANTEICEQTNAFLQHIKYSVRGMSLNRFNHFMQFILHIWSQKKCENFRRRCTLAMNYLA